MDPLIHILHLEDDPADAELAKARLDEAGLSCRITRVQTREQFDEALGRPGYDLILADYRLPGYDGLSALRLARERCPDIPFIFVSGAMGEEAGIEALTQGATDYVLKHNLLRLASAIKRALHEAESRRKHQQAEEAREKLEAQNRQLQKAESLSRMAGAIAHHFNNQLAVVMGNLELTLEGLPRGDSSVEDLSAAMKAARRAAEVSSQMLTYLGQTSAKQSPIDISDICRHSLPLLRTTLPGTIFLETAFSSPGPVINGNANQIQQVLTNLITNAGESIADSRGSIHLKVKTISAENIPGSHRYPIDWQPQDIEAVDVFHRHENEIRCVLSDLTMPRMDGWETLSALRNFSPGIPVVLASGYDESQVMAGDHPERPDAFLHKPFSMKDLAAVIRQVTTKLQQDEPHLTIQGGTQPCASREGRREDQTRRMRQFTVRCQKPFRGYNL